MPAAATAADSRQAAPAPAAEAAAPPRAAGARNTGGGTGGQVDRLGDRLVAAGLLDEDEVGRIIAYQRERRLRFGEAAIQMGLLTERDIQQALAAQFSYAVADTAHAVVHRTLAIAHAPFSPEAEAVRQVRAELTIRLQGQAKPSIAVASAGDDEGKSYLAASLAIAFSQSGWRTLLIDADLRARDKTRLFDVAGQAPAGLSAMLAGRSAATPGQPVPDFPLLHVLASGPPPPNPAEMLAEPALRRLIRQWQEGFDIIIVDTPALNRYSDAQLIGRQVDACVLSARQDRTLMRELRQAQEKMQTAGARLLGTVYNGDGPLQEGMPTSLPARLRALAASLLPRLRRR